MVFSSAAPVPKTSHTVARKSYAKLPHVLDVPNLIKVQLDSFQRFQEEGLRQLLEEVSPIKDLTGNRLELSFVAYEYREPRLGHSEQECHERDLTYSAPLYVKVRLLVKDTGEIKEQDLFFGDIPLMTAKGTFITSGAERVVVSQLLRSPGVYFTCDEDPVSGKLLCSAKLIPTRGAWLEFETSNRNVLSAKIDGKRKIPVTTLLRGLGFGSDDELLKLFEKEDSLTDYKFIDTTLERDPLIKDEKEALLDMYRKLHPGELPSLDNAKKWMHGLFFDAARYDLGNVGRYKLNKRLGMIRVASNTLLEDIKMLGLTSDIKEFRSELHQAGERNSIELVKIVKDIKTSISNKYANHEKYNDIIVSINKALNQLEGRTLTREDIIEIIRHIILINAGQDNADDIDHLGNRRVRTIGELVQTQFRIGFLRLEQVVRERMSIISTEAITPSALVNIRPIVAAVREFFGGSQLSQFMDQTNPLAELTHKRRLSAMGPGGLSRDRAGFEVRDVHFSHYGRICPIETPEGPNIGLIGSLATYSVINEYGFIETPYRRVIHELKGNDERLPGKTATEAVTDSKGTTLVKANTVITPQIAAKLKKKTVKVIPFVSDEINYFPADEEDKYTIAQANAPLDENRQFLETRVETRKGNGYLLETPDNIQLMDVSPKQVVSVATALTPFLEHNDANRALMGANMQRQAVPLLRPEAPLVATGMEVEAAKHSRQVVFAQNAGTVTDLSSNGVDEENPRYRIVISRDGGGKDEYELMKFVRTNQGTCINQRPLVDKGDHVEAGQVLADSSATENGELALGQNVLCAFMSWEGYNFEDAIIISSRLVEEDKFTSIHITKHEVEARDTKLGPEEITRDIPNVGEESLRELDENGIIRIGAEVRPDDTLVGKITPKGETELSAEEKLLRAIFGEKAREVKDTSLRVPHGEWGKVINVKVYTRKDSKNSGDDLPAGVNQWVQVWIAQKRRVSVGDKLAGRHGNKGVISLIAPKEDMPFLPDGTPVDIILDPIGVPSRMNIGQVLETHLGWASQILGFRALTPVFDGADDTTIEDALCRAWVVQKAGAVDINPHKDTTDVKLDVAKEWVNNHGYDGEAVFNESYKGKAREIGLRLWLEDLNIASHDLASEELEQVVEKVNAEGRFSPPTYGKVILHDGRTGEAFDQPVTVGNIYMMKLIHLVEDKVHARSTGPYSLITQQPLGGKAQFGGQRFGEMEVWALEAYGAAHNLQEMLTIKSDDVTGRAKAYESIIKGDDILQPGVPESFKVLVKELQSLGLALEVINEEEETKIVTPEETIEEGYDLEPETEISEEPVAETAEEPETETSKEPEAETAEEPVAETAEEPEMKASEEPEIETSEEPEMKAEEKTETKEVDEDVRD
jgi:DNA-directed RNA polymerase subunit beta